MQGKRLHGALLGVKTDGNPLYGPDVVYRTLLIKISQRDVAALLIDGDGGNRGRHLLDQGQFLLTVAVVAAVYDIFQCGAS